ncbi:hypothetical protein KFL_005880020 [Klebsormidium nitens]|uniref:Cilia- and flagella-associated protein 263 n=1 Tax=Klebsormidium nitens TaxID=105231 RepID=A0A1Y1IKQ7_KLENI|nr:hypothetical protein KFL_005880020 [Klebsormidium nitens]|eukprot:GAQ89999.1 hypothetical protein KFL_005880020 [Klebsormidium nitens]
MDDTAEAAPEDVGPPSDLAAELDELEKANEHLEKENQLLEAYLQRVTPAGTSGADLDEPLGGRKRSPKKKAVEDRKREERLLTMDEKYEIACAEIEVIREETQRVRQESERTLEDLKALLEEADVSIAQTKKESYEFRRDVVMGGQNGQTGKTMAEKVLKYFEDRFRERDSTVEKLRLKNASLKIQISKVESSLQQKEEMGEVLNTVDFDQLKIQNQQFLEKVEERNAELIKLKLTAARTLQILNTLKKKLSGLTWQGTWLAKTMAEKRELLSRYEKEILTIGDEKAAAQDRQAALKKQQEDPELPCVMDYIKLKAKVAELEKKSVDWERKVEIVEMDVKRTRRQAGLTGGSSRPGSKMNLAGSMRTTPLPADR